MQSNKEKQKEKRKVIGGWFKKQPENRGLARDRYFELEGCLIRYYQGVANDRGANLKGNILVVPQKTLSEALGRVLLIRNPTRSYELEALNPMQAAHWHRSIQKQSQNNQMGWWYKKAKSIGMSKERYFEVLDTEIRYYKETGQDGLGKGLLGKIRIHHKTVAIPIQSTLHIINLARQWELTTGDPEMVITWAKRIQNIAAGLRRGSSFSSEGSGGDDMKVPTVDDNSSAPQYEMIDESSTDRKPSYTQVQKKPTKAVHTYAEPNDEVQSDNNARVTSVASEISLSTNPDYDSPQLIMEPEESSSISPWWESGDKGSPGLTSANPMTTRGNSGKRPPRPGAPTNSTSEELNGRLSTISSEDGYFELQPEDETEDETAVDVMDELQEEEEPDEDDDDDDDDEDWEAMKLLYTEEELAEMEGVYQQHIEQVQQKLVDLASSVKTSPTSSSPPPRPPSFSSSTSCDVSTPYTSVAMLGLPNSQMHKYSLEERNAQLPPTPAGSSIPHEDTEGDYVPMSMVNLNNANAKTDEMSEEDLILLYDSVQFLEKEDDYLVPKKYEESQSQPPHKPERLKSKATEITEEPETDWAYWEIDRQHVELGKLFGEGEFGEVWSGLLRGHGETEGLVASIAAKTLKVKTNDPSSRTEFLKEAHFMTRIRHAHLVNLYGVCTTTTPLLIISELCSNGSLIDYMRSCQSPTSGLQAPTLMRFSRECGSGMDYLEQMEIVHRDLAARNVLLDGLLTCKIADFGMAKDLFGKAVKVWKGEPTGRVPVRWCSPEALCKFTFSIKSDVWSFGILLYEIMTCGAVLYPNHSNKEVVQDVCYRGYRLAKPAGVCTAPMYSIMRKCWEPLPTDRPTFNQLLTLLINC